MANEWWSAYTDGSYHDDRPEVVGLGVVIIDPAGNVIVDYGKCVNNRSLVELRNIGGEIGAAYLAVKLAIQLGARKLKLYYDYQGVGMWATRQWDANRPATQLFAAEMTKFQQLVTIHFNHVQSHSGNKCNDRADYRANQAINQWMI